MSDREKVFHPLGMALVKNETGVDFAFIFKSLLIGITRCGFKAPKRVHLLADGAEAITNGFEQGFLEIERLPRAADCELQVGPKEGQESADEGGEQDDGDGDDAFEGKEGKENGGDVIEGEDEGDEDDYEFKRGF